MEMVLAGLKFGAMIGSSLVGFVGAVVLGMLLLVLLARLLSELF